MDVKKINPQFDDLSKPEIFTNHIQELTKTTATPHVEILSQLLEQFKPLDFEAIAWIHWSMLTPLLEVIFSTAIPADVDPL